MTSSQLILTAVCFDGYDVPLSVTPLTTVADVKQQIAHEMNFSPSHFYLTFEGDELEDIRVVVDAGVSDGDVLEIERSSKARALYKLGKLKPTTNNLLQEIKLFGQLVPTFIQAGTELNELSEYWTPLMAACHVGNIDAAQQLLKHKVDLHIRDSEGCVAMMYAACEDRLECLKLLIENGADIHRRDKDGWTALMHSAKMDGIDCLKVLLNEGSDINERDNSGWTALMHAAAEGCADSVRVLIDSESEVNAVCDNEMSPLMYCCSLTVSDTF